MVGEAMSQDSIPTLDIVRVATVITGQGGDFLVYAQCPAGYVPISGGLYTNDLTTQMIESYPDYTNNRWYVRAYTLGTITVTAHVICVRSS
jgi:hypothetical protein